ncbi:MAG: hypothetical protein DLM64_04855 [Solirubrobacterales bacterium]|nr:MAG: hypothetical protein DLM64_04855 [Solirubrobacterales bacterium]
MQRRPSLAELERHIGNLAQTFGWRHHHACCTGRTRDGYPDGFPGETLLRDGVLVFVSIASTSGSLTEPESRWIEELRRVRCVETHILDRDNPGSVARVLMAGEEET